MSQLENARKILTATEGSLRELIERALSEQQYTDVAQIARIADAIARLRSADETSEGWPSVIAWNGAVSNGNPPGLRAFSRRVRTAKKFPRFEREGDKLVKIAWSKKDRAEYEHKAPRRIVDLLIESIRTRKGEGARFAAPDVLPLKDSKSRREFPSYQSYLALGWLRYEGVITKYGRDGYALKPTTATAQHLSELWEALPSRG
jgi:hypothetical protein